MISTSLTNVVVGSQATFTVQDQPSSLCYTDVAFGAGLCSGDIQLVFDHAIFDLSTLQVAFRSPFQYSAVSGDIVSLLALTDDFDGSTEVQLDDQVQTLFTFTLTAIADSGSPTRVGLQATETGAYGNLSGTPADPSTGAPAAPAFPASPTVSLSVDASVTAVPEPSSALLALAGLCGVAALTRRRQTA